MKLTPLVLLLPGVLAVVACGSPPSGAGPAASHATAAPTAAPAAASPHETDPTFVVAPAAVPSGDLEFVAVVDLGQEPSGGEPQLRGGEEARSKEWPASLYATFAVPRGTAACTAALIGPRAMLTAAHCVPISGTVSFVYKGHTKPYLTTCTRQPDYVASANDPSADFALCSVARPFEETVGFLYETVDTSGMTSLTGKTVVLTGFGCISNIVADGRVDGKYRIGFNSIDETSASTSRLRGEAFYAPKERNNLFTANDPAKANLCPGDSGGPTFQRTAGSTDVTKRTIVGVNSRVFYLDATKTSYGSSLISATGGPAFRTWAEKWAKSTGAAACGIAGALPNCRS